MKKIIRSWLFFSLALCLFLTGKNVYAMKQTWGNTESDYWDVCDADGEYDSTCVTVSVKHATYTGNAVTPTVKVVTEDGTTLKEGTDYTLSYSNNKESGSYTASATVKGAGAYATTEDPEDKNEITVHFSIKAEKVTGLKKTTSTAPLANKLTWKKAKGAHGYIVYRSTKKSSGYEKIATLKSGNYTSYQDSSVELVNKKTYYYKVYSYVAMGNLSDDDAWWYISDELSVTENSTIVKIKATSKTKEKYVPIYTGDADLDYAAELICKKIIKKNMSANEKVKAIYTWICKNFEHIKNMDDEAVQAKYKIVYSYSKKAKKAAAYEKKIMKKIYKGKAYLAEEDSYKDRAKIAIAYRKGSCSYINRVFKVLCNHVGISCGIAGGKNGYTNSKGEVQRHYFCYARTGGKYYWYDADIGTTVTRKHNGKVCYDYYKQKSKVWKKNYNWNTGEYPVPKKIQ